MATIPIFTYLTCGNEQYYVRIPIATCPPYTLNVSYHVPAPSSYYCKYKNPIQHPPGRKSISTVRDQNADFNVSTNVLWANYISRTYHFKVEIEALSNPLGGHRFYI